MRATIPVGDRDIGAEVDCEIEFIFTPGAHATFPTFDCAGEPGYPAEVDLISVKANLLDMGGFHDLQETHFRAVASDWLQDAGYEEALAVAADDDEAAREYAAELMADR